MIIIETNWNGKAYRSYFKNMEEAQKFLTDVAQSKVAAFRNLRRRIVEEGE
jgi:hypothetical protein